MGSRHEAGWIPGILIYGPVYSIWSVEYVCWLSAVFVTFAWASVQTSEQMTKWKCMAERESTLVSVIFLEADYPYDWISKPFKHTQTQL